MKLERVIETCLYVDDLERAARFYEQVLELELLTSDARFRAYDVGGASVLLLFRRGGSVQTQVSEAGSIPPHDGHGPLHICFAVDAGELAAWEARLTQHGVAIEGRMRWKRGGSSLYFRDPDGHLLELMTPGNWPNY